jgi:hypothetical protein
MNTMADFFSKEKPPLYVDQERYERLGLTVLRATVMNPYILPMKEAAVQNLTWEFMRELSRSAEEAVRSLV